MSQQAIVSPCSMCQNTRDVPAEGKPACPRRYWKKVAEDLKARGEPVPDYLQPLLLTGTEGTANAGTDALRNPVYSQESHHILVWAAKLEDNMGVYDMNTGAQIAPHILDPSFLPNYTDYIECNLLPYVVEDTEANHFLKGAYREGDQLCVMPVAERQLTLTPGEVSTYEHVRFEGFAKKVDFAYYFNRKPVPQDLAPDGT